MLLLLLSSVLALATAGALGPGKAATTTDYWTTPTAPYPTPTPDWTTRPYTTRPWTTTTRAPYTTTTQYWTTSTTARPTAPTTTTTSGDYRVELQGGDGRSSGNVFATNRNGFFGPVCDDGWGSNEAQVVCRQLGYDWGTAHSNSYWGSVPYDFAMDSIDCDGTEHYLQDCYYSTSEDCGSTEGAGVQCYYLTTTTDYPTTTTEAPTTTVSCPLGWADDGVRGCYLFATQMSGLSWLEALEYCEEQGGFLAEPKTSEQLEFVSSMAYIEETLTGVQAWYVGLSDMGHEGEWVWQFDREDADISNWDVGCPDTSATNSHDCAALVSVSADRQLAAHYRDLNCFEAPEGLLTAPICQRGGLSEETTTTPPQAECPAGWEAYDTADTRKCFKFFNNPEYATTAETNCQSYGGHLASVHSTSEQNVLAQLASSTNSMVYIGGEDNGNWEWTDGTNFDFHYWYSGQPNGQRYIAMDISDSGAWWDRDNESNYYICQLTL